LLGTGSSLTTPYSSTVTITFFFSLELYLT